LAMLRSSATSYYDTDGLGSITSLTNSSGAVAQTYTNDSFGKVTASSGSLTNPFQYTGREMDAETGLYYYRARYYDQSAGRFLSEDPAGFDAGANFYAYVANNSINLIDPKGMLQICCRSANLGLGVTMWSYLNLVPPPCHCFLKLAGGGTMGGYHYSRKGSLMGNLVLDSDNISDSSSGPNHNSIFCHDTPGKDCDQNVVNAFDSSPKTLGGYGFGETDAGTSNDAARLLLKDAGIDIRFHRVPGGRAVAISQL